MRKPLRTAWLPEHALRFIAEETVRAAPRETGGALIGYWCRSGAEVVITDVVGPGPHAIHHVDRFRPDLEYQHRQIALIYSASKRLHTYIGDWHSHPGGSSVLSVKDKQVLCMLTEAPEARAPEPLMAILAGDHREWDLALWQLQRGNRCFARVRFSPVNIKVIDQP